MAERKEKTQLSAVETIEFYLGKCRSASSPKQVPRRPGLYAFFSQEDGECLYIGQAENLNRRCTYHMAWKSACIQFDNPHILFTVIENEKLSELKAELLYGECLLIGLLRPSWNVVVPKTNNSNAQTANNNRLSESLVFAENSSVFESLPIRKAVLLALELNKKNRPGGLTALEIKMIIGRRDNDAVVGVVLRRMANRRQIDRDNCSWDKRTKLYSLLVRYDK